MFQISQDEYRNLRSQIATSNNSKGGRRYLPFAFTELGVAMLSGVLKSDTAVKISIQIINTFVAMRRFTAANAGIFQRLDIDERKQIEHDKKFDEIFDALSGKIPERGIFYDGQIFDAYKFVSDLVRSAEESIYLIDNNIDDSVLMLLSKAKKDVQIKVFTAKISEQSPKQKRQ